MYAIAGPVWLGIAFLGMTTGCVSTPSRVAPLVQEAHFQEEVVQGTTFRHRVFRRQPLAESPSGTLHIYIEGDGRPFIARTLVTSDPTPRDPLMLHLMALDPGPSVYLGRPCYFGLAHDPGCNSAYWTSKRFSPEVVDSLAAVLRAEAARTHASRIELYGHSGGGTLAVLLAARITGVTRVIAIAPTLDIAAWCALHGYTPLLGSLNPAELHLQWLPIVYLVGSADTNTPPGFVEAAAARTGTMDSVRVIPGYTHTCCWQQLWHGVLEETSRH
jgi:pimeloyl-ACP methyl ester carboxylesterase